jgi:hypothetical protein
MIFWPCIILLQLATTLAHGQTAGQSKPPVVPKQAEAMVRSLYREVISRHQLGIQSDAKMQIFRPYLSKALLHRIDLAIACSEDWDRQNPDPNLKPELAWLELGLFTGVNERASPRAFHIERAQSEGDGSFRVYVRLTWGAPPDGPVIWRVAAIVVRQDGRFVVDDVIYLKDEELEIESRLSEWLTAGCDGPRWVGYGNKRADPT